MSSMRSFHSLHCAALRPGQPGLGCRIPAIQPLYHRSARRGRRDIHPSQFSTAIGVDSPYLIFRGGDGAKSIYKRIKENNSITDHETRMPVAGRRTFCSAGCHTSTTSTTTMTDWRTVRRCRALSATWSTSATRVRARSAVCRPLTTASSLPLTSGRTILCGTGGTSISAACPSR